MKYLVELPVSSFSDATANLVFDILRAIARGALFMIFAVIVLLPAAATLPAQAAEQGQIRLGDDYAILAVPKGRGYRWCEQSCARDKRCRSWTYLRPRDHRGGQCRLKHSVAPAFANRCCISGVKQTDATEDHNSLENRCARYARVALEQQDENLAKACGYRGSRWHSDYGLHYRWCLKKSRQEHDNERRARQRALERCESHRKTRNPACQRYAGIAVAQFRAARRNGCGFTGKRWSGDFDKHYNWCLTASPDVVENENEVRQHKIAHCLERGGGRFDAKCHAYAETAVEQAETAVKRDCGYSGRRWSQNYRDHYQFCLKVSPFDRRAETETREQALSRCLAAGTNSWQGREACNHFARVAMAQSRTNEKLKCGLEGALWQTDRRALFRWCGRNSKNLREKKILQREQAISRCIERGGGRFNPVCDEYANKAIAQYQKSVDQGCNFRGERWHPNYIEHYRWCTTARASARRRETRARRRALRLCKFGKILGIGTQR